MSIGNETFRSSQGCSLRVLENGGVSTLYVDSANLDPTVSSIAHLRSIIGDFNCVSLVISASVARYVTSGLCACVACIAHESGGVLNAALNDEGSPVRTVWPLFCLFHLVANTSPGADGMIVFDTSWMLGDSPINPATLPSGTHVDPFAQRQLELFGVIESEAQTPWGQFTNRRSELTQIGGMSYVSLETMTTSLMACPRVVFFPSGQVSAEIQACLLWAGRFMHAFAPEDRRTPLILQSLCMLNFVLGMASEVDESQRITYSHFPSQLEWPNGGNWGNATEIFQNAADIVQRLQPSLAAPAGS
jgi:hypothetical protein